MRKNKIINYWNINELMNTLFKTTTNKQQTVKK